MLRGDLYQPWFLDQKWGFEITSGDFLGVVVEIEKMDFQDDINELVVDYHVINRPELISEEELKGEMFKQVYETIINDIVREAIDIHKNEQNL